jgi:hypothetical protein
MQGLQATARTSGVAYLLIILLAPFAEMMVRSGSIVRGDAVATAANILANEQLWRLAYVADMVVALCDTIVAILLYVLLRPAGRSLAMLGAATQLVLVAIMSINALAHLAALILVSGDGYLSGLSVEQTHSLSYFFLRLHGEAYDMSLFFFGAHCVLVGWLIMRATFMPRVIGLLMAIAGVCYLANTMIGVLAPEFSRNLFPWILLPAFVAELGLALWLLIMGVNAPKWRAQAQLARTPSGSVA